MAKSVVLGGSMYLSRMSLAKALSRPVKTDAAAWAAWGSPLS